MTPFHQLHSQLPREGPGLPGDVAWALEVADTPARATICDAACGPGADTVTLARARPGARIVAIDKMPHFVTAARARCVGLGDRVRVVEGDMAEPGGPFDLIWCAGALYFLGVTEGLEGWRAALAPGGRVAFSEPCLPDTLPETARAFWADYPAITDLSGIIHRVRAAGFRRLGHRMIKGAAWAAYYDPLQARIAVLRPTAEPDLTRVLDEAQTEIDAWRADSAAIAYALLVVAPE